ncbi:hypothetical protein FG386_000277 [Cryptosporidium ryanae]|uniref:uncharacterized protein n=1 Tax=Cryptosporidium ryanae TaxID=515981 RepID=UPI00351A474F|nr:hypothetical protein FG386_000277 [Cryptosporidium ryanae]
MIGNPPKIFMNLAITKPSPPLFPGPQNIVIGLLEFESLTLVFFLKSELFRQCNIHEAQLNPAISMSCSSL